MSTFWRRIDAGRWLVDNARLTIVLVLAVGAMISGSLALQVYDAIKDKARSEFLGKANEHFAAMENGWRRKFDAVVQLADLFRVSPDVSHESFSIYAQSLRSRYRGIQALEWVPYVPHGERHQFEDRVRIHLPVFRLWEWGADGSAQPAVPRPGYFPVLYIEPLKGNEAALGYAPRDHVRNVAMARAIAGDSLAVSGITPLVQGGKTEMALLAFYPVFAEGYDPARHEPLDHLRGLAEGVYMVDTLVAESLSLLQLSGLEIRIDDITGEKVRQVSTHGRRQPGSAPWWQFEGPLPVERLLEIGQRHYIVRITPLPGAFGFDARTPLAVLTAGLAISSLVGLTLMVLMRREKRVRAMVEERTRELSFQATHDSLTGLYNRFEFECRLDTALQRYRSEQERVTVCYIDLDQFKVVNDVCGHAAGDMLLQQIASLLQREIRREDTLARLGGDEFGLLLGDCGAREATHLADRYLDALNGYRFQYHGKNFAIGASIGLAEIDANSTSIATVLSQADAACYIAKDKGRNRVHVFRSDDLDSDAFQQQLEWASKLRSAVEENRLLLYEQPIVPCGSRAPSRSFKEVLIRLKAEDGGIVLPGAFLPAAERYGLMPVIDRWVIDHSFAELSMRQTAGKKELWAINLSAQSITQQGFADYIEERQRRYDVDPHGVCFEITETDVIAQLTIARSFIEGLRSHGFRFSLDDFGSGMSSFAYLKHLPVDFVKIDGVFVRDMVSDPIDRAMVRAIHSVATEMNIRTIAEFVEDAGILKRVRELGIDYAQGYYTGRPTPMRSTPAATEAVSEIGE